MTIKLFGYSSVEHRGEGHEEEGSIFAAIWEGLKEEGACELGFERGFLVQGAPASSKAWRHERRGM